MLRCINTRMMRITPGNSRTFWRECALFPRPSSPASRTFGSQRPQTIITKLKVRATGRPPLNASKQNVRKNAVPESQHAQYAELKSLPLRSHLGMLSQAPNSEVTVGMLLPKLSSTVTPLNSEATVRMLSQAKWASSVGFRFWPLMTISFLAFQKHHKRKATVAALSFCLSVNVVASYRTLQSH